MTGLFLFLVLAETAGEMLELELLQCKDGSFSLFSTESGIFSAWPLGVGAAVDVVGGRRCVGSAWYFCAAGGALVWAPFAASWFSGLFFCLHQVFMKG